MSKKVLIYIAGVTKEVNTEATTWNELQKDLGKANVSYSGMKAVTSDRVTLEHAEAKLPDSDFNLFLFPIKTKSGAGLSASKIEALSFAELKEELKKLQTANESAFKAHFGNYTQKKTADLKALLVTYNPKGAKAEPAKASTSTTVAKAAAEVGKKAATSTRKELPAKQETSKPKDVPKEQPKATEGNDTEEVEVAIDLSSADRETLTAAASIINKLLNGDVKKEVRQLPAKGSSSTGSKGLVTNSADLKSMADDLSRGFNDIKR